MTHAPQLQLEEALDRFLRDLLGKNRSAGTIRAYRADLQQFISFLHDTNLVATSPLQVTRADISEYFGSLADRGLSGVSRARKLAALREYFKFLVDHGELAASPATGMQTPRKERSSKTYLSSSEYTKMLSLAGANPRDYAILQVFLQCGLRVSELCSLTLADVDLPSRLLRVRDGKGMADRDIELEKNATTAIKSYLRMRPAGLSALLFLFLNRYGEPIGERGVRKLVVKYRREAGIQKKVSCHSLRHTFATVKAEKGVSPYQLQQWLGHRSLATTQIYVHLGKQNARRVMEATSL